MLLARLLTLRLAASVASQVTSPLQQGNTLAACIGQIQYYQGTCCMVEHPELPCPYSQGARSSTSQDITSVSAPPTLSVDSPRSTVSTNPPAPSLPTDTPRSTFPSDISHPGLQTTLPSTTSIGRDDVAATLTSHGGKAITSPTTLPGAGSQPLDPTSDVVRPSLLGLSSTVIHGVIPLATTWAAAPEPSKAAAAVHAIESHVIPQLASLANLVPGGQAILVCPPAADVGIAGPVGKLISELQKLNCHVVELLSGMRVGQATSDPQAAKPVAEGVLKDVANVSEALNRTIEIGAGQQGDELQVTATTIGAGHHPPATTISSTDGAAGGVSRGGSGQSQSVTPPSISGSPVTSPGSSAGGSSVPAGTSVPAGSSVSSSSTQSAGGSGSGSGSPTATGQPSDRPRASSSDSDSPSQASGQVPASLNSGRGAPGSPGSTGSNLASPSSTITRGLPGGLVGGGGGERGAGGEGSGSSGGGGGGGGCSNDGQCASLRDCSTLR